MTTIVKKDEKSKLDRKQLIDDKRSAELIFRRERGPIS